MPDEYEWVTTGFQPDTIGWRAIWVVEDLIGDTWVNEIDARPIAGWLVQEQRPLDDLGELLPSNPGQRFRTRVVPGELYDEDGVLPSTADEGWNLWEVVPPGMDLPDVDVIARSVELRTERRRKARTAEAG